MRGEGMNITGRVLGGVALWMLLVSVVWADPPYEYPDVSRRFIGVNVGTKEEIQKNAAFSKPPSRKGVFITAVLPGAAIEDFSKGSIISKVNSKPVGTPEEFLEAIKASPADLPIDLEVSAASMNQKKRMYWASPKKVKAKPMTYGSWAKELTKRTKDDFLNEWIEMDPQLIQSLPVTDMRLNIELEKNEIGKLYWRISYHGDFWIFTKSISVRVGDAIHSFDVDPVRTVLNDASVIETCSGAADDKGLNMIRDVAFGTGEVAVAFHGQNKTIAEPMSENGRMLFQLMALAYMEHGGKGLENPNPAPAEKK